MIPISENIVLLQNRNLLSVNFQKKVFKNHWCMPADHLFGRSASFWNTAVERTVHCFLTFPAGRVQN